MLKNGGVCHCVFQFLLRFTKGSQQPTLYFVNIELFVLMLCMCDLCLKTDDTRTFIMLKFPKGVSEPQTEIEPVTVRWPISSDALDATWENN